MKITYICSGCGALIGCLRVTRAEQKKLDGGLLTVKGKGDIIKCATGDIFIYSLCEFCADNVNFEHGRPAVSQAPDFQ